MKEKNGKGTVFEDRLHMVVICAHVHALYFGMQYLTVKLVDTAREETHSHLVGTEEMIFS